MDNIAWRPVLGPPEGSVLLYSRLVSSLQEVTICSEEPPFYNSIIFNLWDAATSQKRRGLNFFFFKKLLAWPLLLLFFEKEGIIYFYQIYYIDLVREFFKVKKGMWRSDGHGLFLSPSRYFHHQFPTFTTTGRNSVRLHVSRISQVSKKMINFERPFIGIFSKISRFSKKKFRKKKVKPYEISWSDGRRPTTRSRRRWDSARRASSITPSTPSCSSTAPDATSSSSSGSDQVPRVQPTPLPPSW